MVAPLSRIESIVISAAVLNASAWGGKAQKIDFEWENLLPLVWANALSPISGKRVSDFGIGILRTRRQCVQASWFGDPANYIRGTGFRPASLAGPARIVLALGRVPARFTHD